MFAKQENYLYSQLEHIRSKIDGIAVSTLLVEHGYEPPWELLTKLMKGLNEVDMSVWEQYPFSQDQLTLFQQVFDSTEVALNFYGTFRKLSIKAAAFNKVDVPIQSDLALGLAKDWLDMIEPVMKGDPTLLEVFLQIDNQRGQWNKGEKNLFPKQNII
jgi:hypothetical protein